MDMDMGAQLPGGGCANLNPNPNPSPSPSPNQATAYGRGEELQRMSASGLHMGDLHMRDPSSEEEALEYLEYEYDEDGAGRPVAEGQAASVRFEQV